MTPGTAASVDSTAATAAATSSSAIAGAAVSPIVIDDDDADAEMVEEKDMLNAEDENDGDATAGTVDVALLPHSYQHLIRHFPKVFALASLYAHRGVPCTFSSLSAQLGPLFSFSNLRELLFLCPQLLQLKARPPPGQEQLVDTDDPFAPVVSDTQQQRRAEDEYELCIVDAMDRARMKSGKGARRGSQAASSSSNQSQPRVRGPKPTSSSMKRAFEQFKRMVSKHFASPHATSNVPEAPLPMTWTQRAEAAVDGVDNSDDDEEEGTRSGSLGRGKLRLRDELTVSISSNSDAATRPRSMDMIDLREEAGDATRRTRTMARLLGVPNSTDTGSRANNATDPHRDEVQIIDPAPPSGVKVEEEAKDSGSASSTSSVPLKPGSEVPSPSLSPDRPFSLFDGSHASSDFMRNFLVHMRKQRWWADQIVHMHHTSARAALLVPIRAKGSVPHPPADRLQQPPPSAASSPYSAAASASSVNPPSSSSHDAAEHPVYLSSHLVSALASMSPPITSLFTHQSQALHSLLVEKRQVVVVATPTSSGKSMCYTLPILEAMQMQRQAQSQSSGRSPVSASASSATSSDHLRALLLFPTKALAQDQLRSLRAFMHAVGGSELSIDTYDGDTPQALRPLLRERAHVLLSNPDMLHTTILPSHVEYAAFIRNLKFVILDESHVYRSNFGSHVCFVLRRLRRVCAFYGAHPQFILCSATMRSSDGTRSFAAKLLGVHEEDVHVIDEDGSARGERAFVLWNPPLLPDKQQPVSSSSGRRIAAGSKSLDARGYEFAPFLTLASHGVRRSAFMESSLIFGALVQLNYRTLCFGKSRKVVELITDWTRQLLHATRSTRELVSLVRSYRGGYSREDRRRIENQLFSGQLRGVACTNALELGIDVGTLDATCHVGVPNTMASLLQQSGRSGRGTRPALSILIAHDTPLDQYYMRHPEKLFERQTEECIIDEESPYLLKLHVMCAAAELPINLTSDRQLFGPRYMEVLTELIDKRQWLVRRPIDPDVRSPFDEEECYELLNAVWERELARTLVPQGSNLFASMISNNRHLNPDAGPSSYFSIRASTSNLQYEVVDSDTGRLLDSTEERRALYDLFPGALYNHQGHEYQVLSMDPTRAQVRVKKVRGHVGYYTHCIDRKWTTVLSRTKAFIQGSMRQDADSNSNDEERVPSSVAHSLASLHSSLASIVAGRSRSLDSTAPTQARLLPYSPLHQWYIKPESMQHAWNGSGSPPPPLVLTWSDLCAYGRIKVTATVYGYRKFSKTTGKVLERHPLNLPLHEIETWALWVDVPLSIQRAYAKWAEQQGPLIELQQYMVQHETGKKEEECDEERKEYTVKQETSSQSSSTTRPRKRTKRESSSTTNQPGSVSSASASASSASAAASSSASSTATSASACASASSPFSWSAPELNALDARPIHAGLHGLTHCIIALMPMYILCGGEEELDCDCPSVYELSYEMRESRPHRLLIYERIASAGPAFVRASSRLLHRLISDARQLIAECPCTDGRGCPSCVQSGRCGELNEVTDKAAALWLATVLEQWSREERIEEES